MTPLRWAALGLIIAWVMWLVRVYRILHEQDDRDEADEEQAEADRRRRALNGHVSRVDHFRQLQRNGRK